MVAIEISVPINYEKEDVYAGILALLPVGREEIRDVTPLKEKLLLTEDGYRKRLTVAFSASEERERGLLKMRKTVRPYAPFVYVTPRRRLDYRPVVVGAGPAGLFAALILAEAGTRPLLVERGEPVEEREKSVRRFFDGGILDPESNIQYGEGGAGAFSDGKLKFGQDSPYRTKVLDEFILAGAPSEIRYLEHPHLGTDRLPCIVRHLREKILSLGGEVRFRTKAERLLIRDGALVGIGLRKGNGQGSEEEIVPTRAAFFATGHSARDTVGLLLSANVPITPRPFGIGLRVEHPREYIDRLFYGENAPATLGAASYHLVTHLENGRSAYSFCMCPGGSVVAAASAEGRVVTNGMSAYARDGRNSNSALLVSVTPADFGTDDPLAGFALQERIERAAFRAGGGTYAAPACRMEDFLHRLPPRAAGDVLPTYARGTVPVSPEEYLPPYVTESLRAAISDFDAWRPDFYLPDAMLTGAETRSTSPVRLLRTETFEAATLRGLYPVGEGAGYSGGIASSAIDGIRVAEAFLLKQEAK